ncbi:hypothetical protein AMECASPLE_038164 [Ameca splendens]|uniref:Uncharacterized protein n=1 Tax=Ameca splendens TaxID=208324 RepID=A0ABV0Y8C6_9TELE
MGCDGQVLLHRCSSSGSNQLGFFREWRARRRRQPVVVHSVILPCQVFSWSYLHQPFRVISEGVWILKDATPLTHGPCSILLLQAQPLKENHQA